MTEEINDDTSRIGRIAYKTLLRNHLTRLSREDLIYTAMDCIDVLTRIDAHWHIIKSNKGSCPFCSPCCVCSSGGQGAEPGDHIEACPIQAAHDYFAV